MQRMPVIDAAQEEIADIPKIKQRLQQLSQSTQGVQEQMMVLKRQTADANDRSFSRCSSLRSSILFNPATMGLLNKRGNKSMRRFFFADQEPQQQPSLKGGQSPPPQIADTVPEKPEQEELSPRTRGLSRETKESPIDEECIRQTPPRQRSQHIYLILALSSLRTVDVDPRLCDILEKLVEWLHGGSEISSKGPFLGVSEEDMSYLLHRSERYGWIQMVTASLALLASRIQVYRGSSSSGLT